MQHVIVRWNHLSQSLVRFSVHKYNSKAQTSTRIYSIEIENVCLCVFLMRFFFCLGIFLLTLLSMQFKCEHFRRLFYWTNSGQCIFRNRKKRSCRFMCREDYKIRFFMISHIVNDYSFIGCNPFGSNNSRFHMKAKGFLFGIVFFCCEWRKIGFFFHYVVV